MTQAAADLRLYPGARIAIVGGGPSGSFAALHLLRLARQREMTVEVTIFERKSFGNRGPTGCNKCAGILSTRVMRGLQELGLRIPEALVLARLEGYTLHLAGQAIDIARPDPSRTILSVYRGGGPLHGDLPPDVSFDGWLLEQACAAGAKLVTASVRKITAGPLMEVETNLGQNSFHLVVLATGVNTRAPVLEGLSYTAPGTEVMAMDELVLEAPLSSAQRRQAHVYIGRQSGLIFGAVIPKGNYLNLSLLGHDFVGDPVKAFLAREDCGWLAEAGTARLCGCRPKIATSPARFSFGDRFVAVGDAGVTRLYKDGIGSAYRTALQAAQTAFEVGISGQAFARGYAPLCRGIARDNQIGRLLFAPWEGRHARFYDLWERFWLRILLAEEALALRERRGHLAVWNLLTGDDTYWRILRDIMGLKVVATLIAGLPAHDDPGRQSGSARRKSEHCDLGIGVHGVDVSSVRDTPSFCPPD
jgi:flavin-dependent dehydrogenase